jgi:Eukaryotic DNA topoisomerase I, catalytic core
MEPIPIFVTCVSCQEIIAGMTLLLARLPDVAIVDPKGTAESIGLRYVSDERPGIRRSKAGKGFSYLNPDGKVVTDKQALGRIRSIVIPPACTYVWICRSPDGHIQATGRDARGRKQYRYHVRFREIRESTKYEHVVGFAAALPTIPEKVREHMALRGLPREKVLATVVHLLETTLIRIGNDDYAKQNNSYGLTTESPCRRGRKRGSLPFHRQERQAMVAVPARQARRENHQGLSGSPRPEAHPVCRRGRNLPRRDIDGCERLPRRNHRAQYYRERLSHLGGNGSCGNGSQ